MAKRAGRRPAIRPRPSSVLSQDHAANAACPVSHGLEQGQLAAALEGIAEEHRGQSHRAEEKAQGAQDLESGDAGVLDAVVCAEADGGLGDVETEVREGRLEAGGYVGVAARRSVEEEEPVAVLVGERPLEVAFARDQLAL